MVLEYIDLSPRDLLSNVNYLTEPEIVYIIGEVRTLPCPLFSRLMLKVAGASCYEIHYIKEYQERRCFRRDRLDFLRRR
jgi:hypothetical protein